jgi:hypothetical protein
VADDDQEHGLMLKYLGYQQHAFQRNHSVTAISRETSEKPFNKTVRQSQQEMGFVARSIWSKMDRLKQSFPLDTPGQPSRPPSSNSGH